jgi:hypothetical protein
MAEEQWKKQEGTNGERELSPHEAVVAMLNGEVLDRGYNVEEKWDGKQFVYRIIGEKEWTPKPMDGKFVGLRHCRKTCPMDTFECLAWASSPECQGWMVSIQYAGGSGVWRDWDIPQRFKYDGKEEYSDSDIVVISHRRAKVLPDKSGIDESTIQGFLKEV